MGPFLRFSTSLVASFGFLANAAPSAHHDHLARDAATLKAFAKTITTDPLGITDTWHGTNACKYNGTFCDVTPEGYKAVAAIDFNQYHLGEKLSLHGLLDKLLDLTVFHANSNNFTGTVPDVSHLKYLFEFDLSNNQLSGKFPKTLLSAPLTFLDIRNNYFTGPLPDELFKTTDMDVIFVNDNQFTGKIPETGNINTIYIWLHNNKFEGKIPASFGNNKSLRELILRGNKLTGNVPEKLCALDLNTLDVSDNPLSGKLGKHCRALLKKGVLIIDGTSLRA